MNEWKENNSKDLFVTHARFPGTWDDRLSEAAEATFWNEQSWVSGSGA